MIKINSGAEDEIWTMLSALDFKYHHFVMYVMYVSFKNVLGIMGYGLTNHQVESHMFINSINSVFHIKY